MVAHISLLGLLHLLRHLRHLRRLRLLHLQRRLPTLIWMVHWDCDASHRGDPVALSFLNSNSTFLFAIQSLFSSGTQGPLRTQLSVVLPTVEELEILRHH
jgi:hypothetical protein